MHSISTERFVIPAGLPSRIPFEENKKYRNELLKDKSHPFHSSMIESQKEEDQQYLEDLKQRIAQEKARTHYALQKMTNAQLLLANTHEEDRIVHTYQLEEINENLLAIDEQNFYQLFADLENGLIIAQHSSSQEKTRRFKAVANSMYTCQKEGRDIIMGEKAFHLGNTMIHEYGLVEKNHLETHKDDEAYLSLHPLSTGHLVLHTETKLYVYNPATETIPVIIDKGDEFILSVAVDGADRIWVLTEDGTLEIWKR